MKASERLRELAAAQAADRKRTGLVVGREEFNHEARASDFAALAAEVERLESVRDAAQQVGDRNAIGSEVRDDEWDALYAALAAAEEER